MKTLNSLFFLPLFFGCSGGDKDTAMEETFALTDGSWLFGDTSYTNDQCNPENNAATSPAVIDAIIFTLTNVSETEVTLESAAGTQWDCTLDGMTVTCNDYSES